jgi:hypothetical protein
MDRLIDEPAPLILSHRTVARNHTKLMAQRNRAAALNASDFNNMLAQIDSTINHIKMQALAGFMDFGIAKIWVDELNSIRLEIVLPMEVFVSVWTEEKNRTIDSIEMGDDEISSTFIAHRAQLKELFASLAAPELLEIKTQRAGYCASEFAFLAWLWHSVHDILFVSLQSQFHME